MKIFENFLALFDKIMSYINRYTVYVSQENILLEKFLRDLDLDQEMLYTPISSGDDIWREPEIPSKGPLKSFSWCRPKVWVIF